MNRAAADTDQESHRRMLEAFRCISGDSPPSNGLELFGNPGLEERTFFNSTSPFLSTKDLASNVDDDFSDTECLSLDFHAHHSDSTLPYEHLSTCDAPPRDPPLQVDHTGAKVVKHEVSSAWVPSTLTSDMPRSVSMCTSSSTGKYSAPSPACPTVVAAAAVTAAMIVVRDDVVLKRPRSPRSDSLDDDATEASLEDLEDPCSPRSISTFVKEPVEESVATVPQIDTVSEGRVPSAEPVPPPPDPIKRDRAVREERAPVVLTSLTPDAANNASASKKRRAEAMERFRRKKAVRCYGRRVRYQIRKRIATTRPRVNGRFARRTDVPVETAAKPTASK